VAASRIPVPVPGRAARADEGRVTRGSRPERSRRERQAPAEQQAGTRRGRSTSRVPLSLLARSGV